MSLQEAVEAPRFATYNFPGSFAPYTYHPNLIMLEQGIGEQTRCRARKRAAIAPPSGRISTGVPAGCVRWKAIGLRV